MQSGAAANDRTAQLTQIVKAPLCAESNLPLEVVGMFRPRLQDTQAIADARLGHCQFIFTWGQEDAQGALVKTRTFVSLWQTSAEACLKKRHVCRTTEDKGQPKTL